MKLNSESLVVFLKEPRTVLELNEALKEKSLACPDDLARLLSKMRKNGEIKGRFSDEKAAWVYWVDEKRK